jgi:hypothetical protein
VNPPVSLYPKMSFWMFERNQYMYMIIRHIKLDVSLSFHWASPNLIHWVLTCITWPYYHPWLVHMGSQVTWGQFVQSQPWRAWKLRLTTSHGVPSMTWMPTWQHFLEVRFALSKKLTELSTQVPWIFLHKWQRFNFHNK